MSLNTILETPHYVAYQRATDRSIAIELREDATDVASDRRPSMTVKHVEEDGTVNYYEEATSETQNKWKRALGPLLAKFVVKPAVQLEGNKFTGNVTSSALFEFPRGYKLYTHKKGDHYDPRKDNYLIGSQHVRAFRSPQEFFLHAKWLMEGQAYNSDGTRACGCCYCNPAVTQSDIARQYGTGHISDKPRRQRTSRPRPATSGVIQAKDYTKFNVSSKSS
ncbi:unnamed protein product [Somion occarium]|uniref:Cryptic loci regulator 2 N-terminal domain-containing protein n=1 Tax=Somion occarium TaxID=3059160 RepID=A0ABP1DKN6_9APHY